MQEYKDMIQHILDKGVEKSDRTGVGTISTFGYQTRYDLNNGFPMVTIKNTPWKPVVSELLWFLEGSTDERRLAELLYGKPREELIGKRTIWTDNADKQGVDLGYQNDDLVKELGPVYGKNWRDSHGIDQIKWLSDELIRNPTSRRLILSAWTPDYIEQMALPPCHTMFQFYVQNNKLSCQLYQRSADAGLGVPFNIASYALLTNLFADMHGLGVGDFVHTIGDLHLYSDQVEGMKIAIGREPFPLPKLIITDEFRLEFIKNIKYRSKFSLNAVENVKLESYEAHPAIKFKMAV